MNYTVSDNGPFLTIGTDAGVIMIHKSGIRAVKPLGSLLVKLELSGPLYHVYINYLYVTNMPLDNNIGLCNIIASWVLNME